MERSVPVAYVLWIPWDLLGVHRFCLGRIPSGFLYFPTGGL
ncbi:MAG: TM2 domain-containing protein, partial [Verrucomicrobiales bacterium]